MLICGWGKAISSLMRSSRSLSSGRGRIAGRGGGAGAGVGGGWGGEPLVELGAGQGRRQALLRGVEAEVAQAARPGPCHHGAVLQAAQLSVDDIENLLAMATGGFGYGHLAPPLACGAVPCSLARTIAMGDGATAALSSRQSREPAPQFC